MALSKRAQAFEGKQVELVETLNVTTMTPSFRIVRTAQPGERGTITSVTDAGFNGLVFRVRLESGEFVQAYERAGSVR